MVEALKLGPRKHEVADDAGELDRRHAAEDRAAEALDLVLLGKEPFDQAAAGAKLVADDRGAQGDRIGPADLAEHLTAAGLEPEDEETVMVGEAASLVVDLDRNFVLTSSPPTAWNARQRTKLINRMTQALNGDVAPSGVPQHLRSAYGGGKLIPAGQIIVMRGEVESVQDPNWWNQEEVMRVMDHACQKLVSLHGNM